MLQILIVFLFFVTLLPVNIINAVTLETETVYSDETREILSSDGDKYRFILEYDESINIPEGAVLDVEEIDNTDLKYIEYQNRLFELTSEKETLFRFYRLSVKDKDNNTVVRDKKVNLSVKKTHNEGNKESSYSDTKTVLLYDKDQILDKKDIEVSLNNKNEIIVGLVNLPKSLNGETRTYVHSLSKDFISSSGDKYQITLNYTDEASIPDGSELNVSEIIIDDERYYEFLDKSVEVLNWNDDNFSLFTFFDIEIVKGDEKIIPADIVEIQIRRIKENDDETIELDDTQLIALKDDDQLIEDSSFEVDFTSEESSPVISVVEIVKEKQITSSDDQTYIIKVSYNSDSGLPLNAVLDAKEVLIGDDNYDAYVSETQSVLKTEDISYIRVFDISIVDPDTGVKYEPDSKVNVSIELLDTSINDEKDISVVHIKENTAEIESGNGKEPIFEISYDASVMETDVDTNNDSIDFKTDGFSIYVVVQTVIEKDITATDGNTYRITVTYDNKSGIPENAQLVVSEIKDNDPEYDEYLNKTAETLEKNIKDFSFVKAFDIKLRDPDTGEYCQPDKNVTVSIELIDKEIEDEFNLSVVHFKSDANSSDSVETEIISNDIINGVVQFETDGFSVYTICGYTVDFHWGDYTYSVEGGSNILLSELLSILTENSSNNSETEKLAAILADMNQIENVEFSNPELVSVYQVEVLDNQELIEDDYNEELIETTHTDWLLMSEQPFDTAEILTIRMNNGDDIEIPVTDIVWGDDSTEPVTKGTGRHVIADGVTYLLSNSGINDGTARVTSLTSGATIHDTIIYNGHTYIVENIREASGSLTGNTNKMDWDVVKKIATYDFELPAIVETPSEDPTGGDSSYAEGEDNDSEHKIWKKAEYNSVSNSIDYTIKYFQAMKRNVPLDFIFIYDDSASMYSGNRTSGGITLCEAQTTRVLILAAAKALFSKGAQEGYDINIYLGGASTGHNTVSGALTSYSQVEAELATYRTGTTRHENGVRNALTVAQNSLAQSTPRNPVVIYLSDFHQPGTLGIAGVNEANSLHEIAPVYALGTDTGLSFNSNNATRNIPSGSEYYRTMNDIGGGVQELERIIQEAIGYYLDKPLTVTDELYDTIKGQTVSNTTASGNGTVTPSSGTVIWTLGNQNPVLKAGQVYTETFNVVLDGNKVYSGSMPTNKNLSVKENSIEVNKIGMANSPLLEAPITFNLGRLSQDGTTRALNATGVKFTLTENAETPVSKEYTTANGSFEVPYSDFTFAIGKTYTLTQDPDTTAEKITGADAVSLSNPMTWTLRVNSDYTITAMKDGADTDITISNSEFNIWDRELVNPPLVEVYVKKIWDSSVPESQKQTVNFTVYGLNGTEKIELPAYAHDDDDTPAARQANQQVAQITASDIVDNTPYMRSVWIPEYIGEGASKITFKNGNTYNYTIGEAALNNPIDVPDSPIEIIGAPGEWNNAGSGIIPGTIIPAHTGYGNYPPAHDNGQHVYLEITKSGSSSSDYAVRSFRFYYYYTIDGVQTGCRTVLNYGGTDIALRNIPSKFYIPFDFAFDIQYVNNHKFTGDNQYVAIRSSETAPDSNESYTSTSSNVKLSWKVVSTLPPGSNVLNPSSFYTQANRTIPASVTPATLTLTNSFATFKVLNINSVFTDSSLDNTAVNNISAVGYEIVENERNVIIATPEASVNSAVGSDVKVYVPKNKTYSVRQMYYKLNDGTVVNADDSGVFKAFITTPAFDSSSDAEKCSVSGAVASMNGTASADGTVTFTNGRKKFEVNVFATWDPELGNSTVDEDVKNNGIPYKFKWGEGESNDYSVKKADKEVDSTTEWSKVHSNIPTFTIKGVLTSCFVDSSTNVHPDYDTYVESQEDTEHDKLIFTIINTIKKGEITIAKEWNVVQYEETAATETDPPVMGPANPDHVTIMIKDKDNQPLYFDADKKLVNNPSEGSQYLALNDLNGWKVIVTEIPVGKKYTIVETEIGDDPVENSQYVPSYTVAVDGSEAVETSVIESLTLEETVVTVTNNFNPIARVWNQTLNKWVYFEYLITNGAKTGAFNYANTIGGNIIIETLKEGDNGTIDDTNGRYTLASGTTFATGKNITLRTSPGLGFTSTLKRGSGNEDTLFTSNAVLTVESIIIDGGNKSGLSCTGTGGIIKVSSGSLTINNGTTMRNSTSNGGGAVYAEKNTTVTINGEYDPVNDIADVVFDNCRTPQEALQHGGALYLLENTSLTINGISSTEDKYGVMFKNCVASGGGAIWHGAANSKTVFDKTDIISKTLFEGCESKGNNADNCGGGAIKILAKTLNISDSKFYSCKALYSKSGGSSLIEGGAISHGANANNANSNTSTTINSTIFLNCQSSGGGGAISAYTNIVEIEGSFFEECEASVIISADNNARDGGAVDVYANFSPSASAGSVTIKDSTIIKCSSKRNGGGVRSTAANLILDHTVIAGCNVDNKHSNKKDNGKGGGAYSAGNVTLKNGTIVGPAVVDGEQIGGNTLTNSVLSDAAGIYIPDNKTLILGGNGIQTERSVVSGNTVKGEKSNVRLSETDGVNSANSMTIKSVLGEDCHIGVVNAKDVRTNFGTLEGAAIGMSILKYDPDEEYARTIAADDDYLFGCIDPEVKTEDIVIWFGDFICKITDIDGNLLTYNNGLDAVFSSLKSAFQVFKSGTFKDENNTESKEPAYIKMLVGHYNMKSDGIIESGDFASGRPVILTTEDSSYEGKYNYRGSEDEPLCTIRRWSSNNLTLFTVGGKLKITDLVVDGGSRTVSVSGGLFNISAKGILTLSDGAELKNSNTAAANQRGGAIYVSTNGNLYMEGTEQNPSYIHDCTGRVGGAVYIQNGGRFIMGDDTKGYAKIEKCTAKTVGSGEYNGGDGGAVYVGRDKISAAFVQKANSIISECTAEDLGGGVYCEYSNYTLQGNAVIQDCSAKSGGAVYVTEGDTSLFIIEDNIRISGNTSSNNGNGAGIYLCEGSKLRIKGNLSFEDESGDGNTKNGTIAEKNGGEDYTEYRQDIYIAGYSSADARSLVVAGDLSCKTGYIWVFAENSAHYEQNLQFAVIDPNINVDNSSLTVFRNAMEDDETTGYTRTEPLVGNKNGGNVVWGVPTSIEVILRKVVKTSGTNTYESLEGVKFRIFRVDVSEITETEYGYNTYEGCYISGNNGVYFIGVLPVGRYYLVEVGLSEDGSGNIGKVFLLEVNESNSSTESVTVINVSNASQVKDNLKAWIDAQ